MIQFFNRTSKKKEVFKSLKEGKVGIYSCGPTVYWNQHIGHMYAYVVWDVLVRFLRFSGFEVNWIMNITDVGHLTSDEDTGEDKMEKGAKREKLTVWQIAEKYTGQFIASLELLNIQKPEVLSRATEHIKEQIELIKKIEGNGFTYRTKTGLVFDTNKFTDYAKFAGLKLDEQAAGARVMVDKEKKSPWDFLLWVTNQPKHIMQWDSPWGRGFPGWHIECTAMSTKYLGERFDIHTGGTEHIKVHHTNEIAQAHGAFGHKIVNYWLHNGWLTLKGKKMSKSKGNMLLVTDLIDKGFDPMHFRYLVLTSHYRKGIVFDFQALEAAKVAYERLIEMIKGWSSEDEKKTGRGLSQEKLTKIEGLRAEFVEVLSDDLNTAKALASVWRLVKSNLSSLDKLELVTEFDRVLGLNLIEKAKKETKQKETIKVSEEIDKLARERKILREKGEFEKADELRRKIEKKGWLIEDLPSGNYQLLSKK